jgi:YVTN family beta-propeller protein
MTSSQFMLGRQSPSLKAFTVTSQTARRTTCCRSFAWRFRRRPWPEDRVRLGRRRLRRGSGTATPGASLTDLAARAAGGPARRFATASGGRTAYVLNYGSGSVTPIATATNKRGQPIKVGNRPLTIAITP